MTQQEALQETRKRDVCRLDIKQLDGEWRTYKSFDNLHQAEQLALTLNSNGIPATVSCACGSYDYGDCEQCRADVAITTLKQEILRDSVRDLTTFLEDQHRVNESLKRSFAELMKAIEQYRRKVHNVEQHNQHFDRCESAWCHPTGDQLFPQEFVQGDRAALANAKGNK